VYLLMFKEGFWNVPPHSHSVDQNLVTWPCERQAKLGVAMSHLEVLLHVDVTAKTQSIKDKIGKLDVTKIKTFSSVRDTNEENEATSYTLEEIVAGHTKDLYRGYT